MNKIRTKLSTVFLAILIAMPLWGNGVIKNPAKPLNSNYGRVVTVERAMAITDEHEGYFFKKPIFIKVAHDGSIYVMDNKQMLKFTPDGKFVKNLFKKGLGPNEMVNLDNFLIMEDNSTIIHSYAPNKILHLDSKCNTLAETRLPFERFVGILHVDQENYFFIGMSSSAKKKILQPKVIDMDQEILAVSKSDYSITKKFILPLKAFFVETPAGSGLAKMHYLLDSRLRDNFFFFSSSHEYGIKLYDLNKNTPIREFTREYKRVKVTEETKEFVLRGGFKINGKMYDSPTPEFLDDIQSLHVVNGKLLVVTSTVDSQKGVLVDVYNENGRYLDCFYLKFAGKRSHYNLIQARLAIKNDAAYLIEKDKDENWVISKYPLILK